MSSPDPEQSVPQSEAQRVEQLFHEAVQLPVRDQAAFLARRCGEDEALRHKVSALLSAGRDSATAWDRGALDMEARHSAGHVVPAQPGQFFGPYRIVRCIAAGGMGFVYEAWRDDPEFQKRVAIKFVQRDIDDPAAIEQFRIERQILAQLEHPNIARLLDGGTTAEGIPYLVMEYVDGERIDRFVTERRMSRNDRLKLFLDVCEAVQHAHRNLVVHRDLKPGNILVTSDGVPKLLDFGIAKLLNAESRATTVRALTPEHASPEQLLGGSMTTTSDVYSLGVLLFVLLADRLPYRASAAQPADLMRAICEEEPVWAPAGLIRGDLRSILAKALNKEPQRRYLSVEQFAGDIRRHMAGLPVLARPEAFLYRARKFVVRRAFPLAAIFAVVAAALIGGLSTLAESRRGARRFNEVRTLAHSMLFDVYDSISKLPGSVPARRLVVSRAQQYLDSLASEAGSDPVLVRELAESYIRLGDVRGRPYRPNLGDTTGALESYRKAQSLLERMAALYPADADLQERLVEAYMDAGRVLERQGDSQADIDVLHRAIRTAEALRERRPQNLVYTEQLARATQYLGGAQLLAARRSHSITGVQQALETYQKALAIQETAGPQRDESWRRSLALRYFYIGYALRELGDLTGDVSYYQRALGTSLKGQELRTGLALAHTEQPDPRISRSVADGLSDIGWLRWKCCHDPASALRDLRESLERFQQLSSADPENLEARRDVANLHSEIGAVLVEAGQASEGVEFTRKALGMYEELHRADPSSLENAGNIAEVRARLAAFGAKD